jgi:beta-lactam-binding protein with PASTA domain
VDGLRKGTIDVMLALKIAAGVLIATALVVAAGCGGNESPAAATETVTVVQGQESGGSDDVTETVTVTEEDAGRSDGGGDIAVPDVVGMDHQLAQDTMQAAGLYNLSEEDATGQGRLLLWDRNWTVVGQSPSAGAMVTEDQTIILSSKKDGE